MSQWDEKFKSHAIHTTLENLEERLSDENLKSDDLSVIEHLDRIHQLSNYAAVCFGSLIPALVNQGHLNNANSYIQSVISELNNYISSKNIAYLNNVSSHIDNVMSQLIALPMQSPAISQQSFTKSLIAFKSLTEKTLSEIKEAKDELQASVSEISNDANEQKTLLENLVSEIHQHSENIDSSLEGFNSKFESFETEFNNQLEQKISDVEEKYDIYTENMDSTLSTKLEENKAEVDKLLTTQKDEFSTQVEDQKTEAVNIITSLEDKKEEASNLLQIIGNIGITGNYKNIANQEKESADNWRKIALGLMITMVAVIGITIFISATNGFDWKLALFRIGAALILAVPAAYAAKESAKHRQLENHNRRSELELASLDPFLEKLPEGTRNKVKEELTKKFFGFNSQEPKVDDPVSSLAILDLLKTAITKK